MVKKILIVIGIIIGLFVVGAAVFMIKIWPALQEVKQIRQLKINDINLTKVQDGTYQGDFTYGEFTYQVAVTITNHRIENIKILKNRQTTHAQKAEGVIERIIQKQSPNVDAITGATTTSKALMKAVENALTKSSGQ